MMKKSWLFVTMFLFLTACGSQGVIKDESSLQKLTSKRVLELGAERYVDNDYNGAEKYYRYVLSHFTNEQEATAWANYEIGFIRYQEGKEKKALKYFAKVLKGESPNIAPQVLAAKVKDIINSRPPVLDVRAYSEYSETNAIRSDEKGLITVDVVNHGSGIVNQIKTDVLENKSTSGMRFIPPSVFSLATASSNQILIPFAADKSLETGTAKVVLRFQDPAFSRFPRYYVLSIPKIGLPKPKLVASSWKIVDGGKPELMGNQNGIVNNGEVVELDYVVSNAGKGMAYGVMLEAENAGNKGVKIMSPLIPVEFGNLAPGEFVSQKILFRVNADFYFKRNEPKSGAVKIKLTEMREFGEASPVYSFPIDLIRPAAPSHRRGHVENGVK